MKYLGVYTELEPFTIVVTVIIEADSAIQASVKFVNYLRENDFDEINDSIRVRPFDRIPTEKLLNLSIESPTKNYPKFTVTLTHKYKTKKPEQSFESLELVDALWEAIEYILKN